MSSNNTFEKTKSFKKNAKNGISLILRLAGKVSVIKTRQSMPAGRLTAATGRHSMSAGKVTVAETRQPMAVGRLAAVAGKSPMPAGTPSVIKTEQPTAVGRLTAAVGKMRMVI